MMNKNYSIITNYGCHFECPYCIVKNNNIQVEKTDNEKVLESVRQLYRENDYHNLNFLSVSGGGDPLHNFDDERREFYRYLSEFVNDFELHTSYLGAYCLGWTFDRIVYHLRDVEQLKDVKRWYQYSEIRVVFVVQDKFTKEDIDYINEFCEKSKEIDQWSFRQMVDGNYKTNNHLKDYIKSTGAYYIEQDDYNNYIINDKIITEFESLKWE